MQINVPTRNSVNIWTEARTLSWTFKLRRKRATRLFTANTCAPTTGAASWSKQGNKRHPTPATAPRLPLLFPLPAAQTHLRVVPWVLPFSARSLLHPSVGGSRRRWLQRRDPAGASAELQLQAEAASALSARSLPAARSPAAPGSHDFGN